MKIRIFSLLLGLILAVTAFARDGEKFIPASASSFSYMGRVSIENNQAEFNWPGTMISTLFEGETLGIKIVGGESNYFNVWVDEQSAWVLYAPVDSIYWFPEALRAGRHRLKIVKRTEADMGMAHFSGIYIEKWAFSPEKSANNRRLMFIGNSITCGYGSEGKDKTEHFSPATENCDKSYATILARAFNAQYQLVSHSGLGMVRNYGDKQKLSVKVKPMPARLEYLFDNNSSEQYDLNCFCPDAVVINLGTNDFSTKPFPDETDFIDAGIKLIRKIRSSFPGVKIFCITGPMTNEPCYSYTKKMVESVRDEMNTKDIIFIGVPVDLLDVDSDLGADWHPSYRGQIKTANLILPVMATVLNWDYSFVEIDKVLMSEF